MGLEEITPKKDVNITEQFFKTFGIEPEINYVCDKEPCKQPHFMDNCKECSHLYDIREDYPQITSDTLLRLICIMSSYYQYKNFGLLEICSKNMKDLKNEILSEFIDTTEKQDFLGIKNQVRSLFEEAE